MFERNAFLIERDFSFPQQYQLVVLVTVGAHQICVPCSKNTPMALIMMFLSPILLSLSWSRGLSSISEKYLQGRFIRLGS